MNIVLQFKNFGIIGDSDAEKTGSLWVVGGFMATLIALALSSAARIT